MMRFDGRSADGRRLGDLYRSYMSTLGNPADAGTQAMILSAAEQVVGAEKERADYFAGRQQNSGAMTHLSAGLLMAPARCRHEAVDLDEAGIIGPGHLRRVKPVVVGMEHPVDRRHGRAADLLR